jgi:hypothetical protein
LHEQEPLATAGSSQGKSITVTVTYHCTVLPVTNEVTEESMYHTTLVTVSKQMGWSHCYMGPY